MSELGRKVRARTELSLSGGEKTVKLLAALGVCANTYDWLIILVLAISLVRDR